MTGKIAVNFATAISTPPTGVDIWLLDVSAVKHSQFAEFSTIISVDEMARAQQRRRNKDDFLATRIFLRKVLACYTGVPAQELLFTRSEHGKPFLTNAPTPLYFNLSHSGKFAALAINSQHEIGVDIETLRQRHYLQIAERYFHPNELQQLYACPDAEQKILFYKLWTLKEAFFKATGGGIASGLDKVDFNIQHNNITANYSSVLSLPHNDWQFQQTFITHDTLIALAFNAGHAPLIQWFNGNSLLGK